MPIVPKQSKTTPPHTISMAYVFLDHATDAQVEVRAREMKGALKDAAYATIDIMLDRKRVDTIESRQILVESDTIHDMLYGWLEEIIYQTVTEGFAVRRMEVTYENKSGQYMVRANLSGEPLDTRRHRFKVEIKAPTYHEMDIEQNGGIKMKFLLDL